MSTLAAFFVLLLALSGLCLSVFLALAGAVVCVVGEGRFAARAGIVAFCGGLAGIIASASILFPQLFG